MSDAPTVGCSSMPPGKIVKSFGAGVSDLPQRLFRGQGGNIWVTSRTRRRGGARRGPRREPPGRTVGYAAGTGTRQSGVQVQPRRQSAAPRSAKRAERRRHEYFTAERRHRRAQGEIFVLEGTAPQHRVLKLGKTGKFTRWGKLGTGPR